MTQEESLSFQNFIETNITVVNIYERINSLDGVDRDERLSIIEAIVCLNVPDSFKVTLIKFLQTK